MDSRQLATFVAVARHGSFSLAAAELGYTQSAVSQHIATLEERAGQRLLERRPVRLTTSGERLLAHAEAILLRLDAAETELRHARAPAQQHLRIGATAPAAGRALARSLGHVVSADIRTATREDVLRDLAAARVDIALVGGYGASGEPLLLGDPGVFATALIDEEPTVVAVADDHPLAGRAEVPLGDLADAWWIDAPLLAAPLPALRRLAGAPDGFRARTTYGGEDPALLLALIAERRGVALLPVGVAEPTSAVRSDASLVHRVEAAWLRAAAPPGLEGLLAGLRG